MSVISIKNFPETQLAGYQQNQMGNNCAYHAVSAAINILSGSHIDGQLYADRVNDMAFPKSLKYRLYDNGPTLPFQQVNLAEWIGIDNGLSVDATRTNLSAETLRFMLMETNKAVLVTIGWFNHHPPEITFGKKSQNMNASPDWAGYHTMLLGAYNPSHISVDGIQRPWGLINSWVSGGRQLFWMQDSEFLRSWGVYTPLSGSNASVIIEVH